MVDVLSPLSADQSGETALPGLGVDQPSVQAAAAVPQAAGSPNPGFHYDPVGRQMVMNGTPDEQPHDEPFEPWKAGADEPFEPWKAGVEPAPTAAPPGGAVFGVPGQDEGEVYRRIGNAIADKMGDAWTGSQLIGPDTHGLPPDWQKGLQGWVSGPAVAKEQQTVLQAFREAFLAPAAMSLAEDAINFLQNTVREVQPAWRAGAAVIGGMQAGVAQLGVEAGMPLLGREIAAFPEAFPRMGHELAIHPGPLRGPAEPLRLPTEPTPPAPLSRTYAALHPDRGGTTVLDPRVITPDFIEAARREGIIGPRDEWDGTSVYSAAPDGLPAEPMDAHGIARQIDPETMTEYDRLRAVHDLALQEFRDETERARAEVEASAPHTQELADIGARLNDIENLPNERNIYRERQQLQRRQERLRAERDAYLANQDLPELVLSSPENMQLRNFIADNARQMLALEPRVRDVYAEASRRLPEPEIALAGQEAVAEPAAPPVAPEPPSVAPEPGPVAGEPPRTAPEVTQNEGVVAQKPAEAPVTDIAAHVADRMRAAGRPTEEADAFGAVVGSFFDAMAAREGRSAADLYREHGPEIVGRAVGQRGASGSLSRVNGRSILTLFAKADPSTVIHEFGHFGTQTILRMADEAGASEATKVIAKTIREWVGAPEGAELTRNQHERMARGLETYFRTGAAPSPRLAAAFAQFKDWIGRVYEGLKSKGTPINDAIKGAFDQWFATPEEKASVAPEETGPPRVRSVAQIMEEDGLSPDRAQARNFAEIGALAEWQQAHPEAVAALREARAGKAPQAKPPEAEPAPPVAATPEAAPAVEPAPAEPEPVVAQNFGPEAKPPPPKPSTAKAYVRVPKEPKRLTEFLKEGIKINEGTPMERIVMRGLMPEPNGIQQLRSVVDDTTRRGRTLINERDGEPLDEARRRAVEAGYFPQGGEVINDLYNAIAEDRDNSTARYSMYDDADVAQYEAAIRHNQAIDREAAKAGIDPRGMTMDAFNAAMEEYYGKEAYDREEVTQRARIIDAENDARSDLSEWEGTPRVEEEVDAIPLEDIERHWREAEASQSVDAGQDSLREPGVPNGPETEGSGAPAGSSAGPVNAGPSGEAGQATAPEPSGTGPAAGAATEPSPERAAHLRAEPVRIADSLADDIDRRKKELPAPATVGGIRPEYFTDAEMNQELDRIVGQLSTQPSERVRDQRVTATHMLIQQTIEDLRAAADKWQGNRESTEAATELLQAQKRFAMAHAKLGEIRWEWADVGHQMNQIIRGYDKLLSEISAMPTMPDDTLFQIQRQLGLLLNSKNTRAAGSFAGRLAATRWDIAANGVQAVFINAWLSNFVTHAGYLFGTAFSHVINAAAIPVEAAYGLARGVMTGDMSDRVLFGETPAHLFGLAYGGMKGFLPAYRAFMTGEVLMRGLSDLPIPHQQAIVAGNLTGLLGKSINTAGYGIETSTRIVSAIHVMNYSMAYTAEVSRLAYRAAIQAGANPLEAFPFGTEIQRYMNAIPGEDMAFAHDQAIRSVFMKRPEYGSRQAAVARFPVQAGRTLGGLVAGDAGEAVGGLLGKLLVPFPQIGMNLAEEGLVRTTPLGLVSGNVRAELARGGARQDVAAGRMITGSMIGAGMVSYALSGLLTGPGVDPTTEKGRAINRDLAATGWVADAVRWGDTFLPYRKFLGAWGELVSMSAALADGGRFMAKGEYREGVARVTKGFADAVVDETAFRALHGLFETLDDFSEKAPVALRNFAASGIPFSQALSAWQRQQDPFMRRVTSVSDAFSAHIPYLSEGLHPVIGPDGQPVLSHSSMGPHAVVDNPVSSTRLDLGIGASRYPTLIKGVKMSPDEQEDFERKAGVLTQEFLMPLVTAPGFRSFPRGAQIEQINSYTHTARQQAEEYIQAKYPHLLVDSQKLGEQKRTEGRAGGVVPALR